MTKRSTRALGIFAALSLGLFTGVYTLQAQAQNASPTATKKKKFVHVDSETGQEENTPQGTIQTLNGNVHIKLDDTTLTTDKAIYNKDTGVATSPGKLKLNDSYNTLTALTGTAHYNTRDAKFRGNVVIVARPKPEDQKAPKGSARRQFDTPATITSEKVDYNWRTRIAQILDGMTIKQKDRTVVADRGTYDARSETAVLEGNVKYTKPNGDWATAKRVVMILKEGAEKFTATGGVNAAIEIKDEDEEETPATAPVVRGTNVPGSTSPGTTPTTPPVQTPPPTPPANPETLPTNGGGATP